MVKLGEYRIDSLCPANSGWQATFDGGEPAAVACRGPGDAPERLRCARDPQALGPLGPQAGNERCDMKTTLIRATIPDLGVSS